MVATELSKLKWKLNKGIANLSYVGGMAIFVERRYYGDVVRTQSTTKDCTCQTARNGYLCQHIKYLREGNNMLDMSVEF